MTSPGPRIHSVWGRIFLALGLQLVIGGFLGTMLLALVYVLRRWPAELAPGVLPDIPTPTPAELEALLREPPVVMGYFLIHALLASGVVLFVRLVVDREGFGHPGLDVRRLRNRGLVTAAGLGAVLAALIVLFVGAVGGRHIRLDLFRGHGGAAYLPSLLFVAATAVSEEWLLRGYVFTTLRRVFPAARAILVSALAFTLVHADVPGSGFLSWFNLLLAGIVLGQLRELTGSLAVPVGAHLGWSLCLAGLLGADLGGFPLPSVLRVSFHDLAPALGGGEYGPEASVVVSVVLAGLAVWMARMLSPRQENDLP